MALLSQFKARGLMFSVDGLFHQGPNGAAVITVQGAGAKDIGLSKVNAPEEQQAKL